MDSGLLEVGLAELAVDSFALLKTVMDSGLLEVELPAE